MTAEFLEGPMSLQDRIVPIRVQEITPKEEKQVFLNELDFLQKNNEKLWECYWKFSKAVYENKEEIEKYLMQKLKTLLTKIN